MLSNREIIELKSKADRNAFEVRYMAHAIAALFILVVVASITFVSHPESRPAGPSSSEPLQVVPAAAAEVAVPASAPAADAAAAATPRDDEQADRPPPEELSYATYGG